MTEMNRVCRKILFQSRSIGDRNSGFGAKAWWVWRSKPIKRFRWYSGFQEGRELVEVEESGGRPKST
jgi:hypothetical protein